MHCEDFATVRCLSFPGDLLRFRAQVITAAKEQRFCSSFAPAIVYANLSAPCAVTVRERRNRHRGFMMHLWLNTGEENDIPVKSMVVLELL